jgi:hypothetical protein
MRYHRVRLHANDDPHYRAYLANIMASKANHRAMHVASNRALFGNESEGIIRQWLQDFHPLSQRRFVEYDERAGKRLIRKYREIDAVFEYDTTRIHIFEMKATSQARSIMRGIRQLNETRNILAQLFPTIYATLILVDTGIMTDAAAATLMQQADAPINSPYTIERFYADNPHIPCYDSRDYAPNHGDELTIVRFPLADIISGAAVAGITLHLDWDDDDDESEPITPPTHISGVHTDDDNAFAAALRKAGLSS